MIAKEFEFDDTTLRVHKHIDWRHTGHAFLGCIPIARQLNDV